MEQQEAGFRIVFAMTGVESSMAVIPDSRIVSGEKHRETEREEEEQQQQKRKTKEDEEEKEVVKRKNKMNRGKDMQSSLAYLSRR
ncbi:conserved hypothetical protein [Ricinus communis]|uniref:Uncharacterized protein n=1 Tax=Ricinus communis TaxID=3988 RepID=B9SE85_RICCO|nr:conserved hypothetical protein [Ricinus communis]